MKRKLLTFMFIFTFVLLIPMKSVMATNITIDNMFEKMEERLNINVEFVQGIYSQIAVTKEGDKKIIVTTTTDISNLDITGDLGDMKLKTYIIYEYEDLKLSFKGDDYGNNIELDEDDIYKKLIIGLQSEQNKLITKEATYAAYNLKGYEDSEIETYLKTIGLLNDENNLVIKPFSSDEIKITMEDGFVKEYTIDLKNIENSSDESADENPNEPTLPEEDDESTNEPTLPEEDKNQNDSTTEKPEDKNEKYQITTEDYLIEFVDEIGSKYTLNVIDIINATEDILKEIEEKVNVTEKEINNLKEILNNEGTLLNLYEINVIDEHKKNKEEGPFTFKIKLTPEMKKYNLLKLVNVEYNDGYEKKEVIQLKIEGDYLVGILPHLSTYALTGTNIKNPATGIETYMLIGGIALITMASVYFIYRKENNI